MKPSEKNITSAISAMSCQSSEARPPTAPPPTGTIMEIGRRIALRLSGSSVLPAYPGALGHAGGEGELALPGFIVTKMPQVLSSLMRLPSK
eukprot:758242-Hanusia_phi.AAC.9